MFIICRRAACAVSNSFRYWLTLFMTRMDRAKCCMTKICCVKYYTDLFETLSYWLSWSASNISFIIWLLYSWLNWLYQILWLWLYILSNAPCGLVDFCKIMFSNQCIYIFKKKKKKKAFLTGLICSGAIAFCTLYFQVTRTCKIFFQQREKHILTTKNKYWRQVPNKKYISSTIQAQNQQNIRERKKQILNIDTLFRYPFHPRVSAIAPNRSGSFCQKCRWQLCYS